MKKIFLLLLALLLIGSVCASSYSNVTIDGNDFEIPQQYSSGSLNQGKYVCGNLTNFAILHVDDYIINNYGGNYKIADFKEKLTINERPAMLLTYFNTYIKENISLLYFPVGESVYCIYFRADNLTPEISHIVETAGESDMSSENFYGILKEAVKEYNDRRYQDALSADYYPSHSDNQRDDSNNDFIKWYLLTHWR